MHADHIISIRTRTTCLRGAELTTPLTARPTPPSSGSSTPRRVCRSRPSLTPKRTRCPMEARSRPPSGSCRYLEESDRRRMGGGTGGTGGTGGREAVRWLSVAALVYWQVDRWTALCACLPRVPRLLGAIASQRRSGGCKPRHRKRAGGAATVQMNEVPEQRCAGPGSLARSSRLSRHLQATARP